MNHLVVSYFKKAIEYGLDKNFIVKEPDFIPIQNNIDYKKIFE